VGEGKDFLDRYAIAQDATLPAPKIDIGAMRRYRLARRREQMQKTDVPLCVLTNPVSMRHATDFRNYQLFQSRILIAYLFVPVEGPVLLSDYPFEKELLEG